MSAVRKLKKSATEIFSSLCQVYGEGGILSHNDLRGCFRTSKVHQGQHVASHWNDLESDTFRHSRH